MDIGRSGGFFGESELVSGLVLEITLVQSIRRTKPPGSRVLSGFNLCVRLLPSHEAPRNGYYTQLDPKDHLNFQLSISTRNLESDIDSGYIYSKLSK